MASGGGGGGGGGGAASAGAAGTSEALAGAGAGAGAGSVGGVGGVGGDLWRECALWLTRTGMLRRDHRANWPSSSIHDLAHTLRDGVLLCNLLNVLDPHTLDMKDVNQRPQMAQFLCLRNIRVFLRACHEKLQLREADLFDPSMLFDLSNFHRVLCTLAKLSQCPKALAKNIKSFSAHRTQSQEDIYKDLQSIGAPPRPKKNIADPHEEDLTEYTSYCARIRDEEIYHDLCSVKSSAKPTARQNTHHSDHRGVHMFSASREATLSLATSTHSLEKRDYVIRELVDTETNYVDVLGKIDKYFIKVLSPIMKLHDVQVIFYGIKELCDIHSGFVTQLQQATAGGGISSNSGLGIPRLGDVFLSWRERFLLYGDYCSNLTAAQDSLKFLSQKDDVFSKKLTKCQKEHSDGRIQLRDILSVPMQRILKYHLLLDKLVHETQPNHEDFRSLERAKEAMVDVAQYINEVKRDSEVLVLLGNVQDSIQDWELPMGARLADYGRLLLDGELRVRAHDDQKLRSRYVFVFDKVMVLCKTVKENQYSFRTVIKLSEWRVEEDGRVGDVGGGGRWSARWFLVHRSQGGAFTLYARNDDARRRWIAAVTEALDNMEPAGCRSTDHKFVLHTFEKPVTCHHCSKFLKGRIFQGYLCTVCGSSVHKACIVLSGRCGIPPPAPPPLPPALANPQSPDHALHYYMWFVGEMGRDVATTRLERRLDGTFLLRVRPNPTQGAHETHYALSLKTDNTVKHMRVCKRPIDSVQHYYLSESRFFRSVIELVSYYEKTSLVENFVGLNVILRWPFRRVVATATHDFRPSEGGQLPLRTGSKILVLSKEGDSRGWWKGRPLDRHSDFQSGFFPKDCVREDPEFLGNLD
ncbi:vav guanine nucleotide exchange factor [Arctopsyche grandis]|uniref:vav guanine nucleotide exchange factor n=1 Tax=Arctopsyche grandis TaxID=121162 RepID=UPI00406D6D0D